MAGDSSTLDRLDEDFGWSPRQRQVLDLLAQGQTNAQVAEALGISLDGAKWHVREVLSKLGVDSREEAAEYWRAYNSWRRRGRREARALVAVGGLRWSLAGLGAVAGAVVVVWMAMSASGTTNDAQLDAAMDDATTATSRPQGLTRALPAHLAILIPNQSLHVV